MDENRIHLAKEWTSAQDITSAKTSMAIAPNKTYTIVANQGSLPDIAEQFLNGTPLADYVLNQIKLRNASQLSAEQVALGIRDFFNNSPFNSIDLSAIKIELHEIGNLADEEVDENTEIPMSPSLGPLVPA